MNMFLLLKTAHIFLSAVILGTGLGTAFFLWFTHRTGELESIVTAARLTVRADLLFTAPAVVLLPVTGYLLMQQMHLDFHAPWLQASVALYVFAGACWLPLVWLQWHARHLAEAALRAGTSLPAAYHRCMRIWFVLGWPAFFAVLAILWLMVARPARPL